MSEVGRRHIFVRFLTVLPLLAAGALYTYSQLPQDRPQCVDAGDDLQLCALSGMAKLSDQQWPAFEHQHYAIRDAALVLHAARNETIAHQWLIKGEDRAGLRLEVSHFSKAGQAVEPQPHVSQYLAHYHHVDRGGYSWGPETEVLPWPARYPDALVPEFHSCTGERIYNTVPSDSLSADSTLFWQDTYVPPALAAGHYQSTVNLFRFDTLLASVDIELQVWPVTLPDENSIDAVGELYRTYRMEGVGEEANTDSWRAMSNCYQQLAHAHRSTFLERNPEVPKTEVQWRSYQKHYGAMLDGSLFSEKNSYIGPGQNTPVSVWRTPWPQPYDMQLQSPLSYVEIRQYESKALKWHQIVTENDWTNTRWFAYVFDEVDGPEHTDKNYLAMAHQQMSLVQDAIDAGSRGTPIDLLWTSHSNPADWSDDESLDLRSKVRLWAPNAHAADPTFLAEQKSRGDRLWFYHSGHPAVGAHSINASGIELRTWGVIAARYDMDGVLMWAVNLGNDDKPFADPSYKPDDDRFGNGVLLYPGQQLAKIGFKASPGAIPSIRLKSWRRGLQDFELLQLAKNRHPKQSMQLLKHMIPQALADGRGAAAWSSAPADWIEFKLKLLKLAAH